jgi:two-component system nitrogen regulation response regulator NtrX
MTRKEKILIVDDEPGVRSSLRAILEDEGFEVEAAATGEDGLAACEAGAFDALLLDVWLPGIDGLDTLVRLKERRSDAAVVMISGHGTIDTAVRATKLGAFDFVEKPLSLERTLLVLRNALRQRRLERRNFALLAQLSRDTEILGRSESAERLRRAAAAAAASDAPVLLRGERGTGRETIARRVHGTSRRAEQPFVAVPCGALDEPTGAHVLFGAPGVPGGRVRLAAGGSLFLEDVDGLPPALQARLAAFPVDAPDLDVRLIASAPPDGAGILSELAAQLDVVRIEVPPLRDRREDIETLAVHFMRDLAREYGRPERRFDPASLAAMARHDWPGNVRELRNLVERLLLLARDEVVAAHDLPLELGGARPPAEDLYREFRSLAEGVESFERYFVRRVWFAARGDLAAAARRLDVEPGVLAERLERLGIS